jgi:hypothetical protein
MTKNKRPRTGGLSDPVANACSPLVFMDYNRGPLRGYEVESEEAEPGALSPPLHNQHGLNLPYIMAVDTDYSRH